MCSITLLMNISLIKNDLFFVIFLLILTKSQNQSKSETLGHLYRQNSVKIKSNYIDNIYDLNSTAFINFKNKTQ